MSLGIFFTFFSQCFLGPRSTLHSKNVSSNHLFKDHVKRTMEKGLYTLEDGELIPEPTLSDKGKVGTVLMTSMIYISNTRSTSWRPRRGRSCHVTSVELSSERSPTLSCTCWCTRARAAGWRREQRRRKLELDLILRLHCIIQHNI